MKRKPPTTLAPGYGRLLADIKDRVRAAQIRAHLAANSELLALYWDVGRLILGRQKAEGWGTKVIDRLSRDLQNEFPGQQGFSPRNLKYMRAFAEAWPETVIVQQPVAQSAGSGEAIVHPPGAQTSQARSSIVQAPLAQSSRTAAAIVHQPGAQLPWTRYRLYPQICGTPFRGFMADLLAVPEIRQTVCAEFIGGTHQDQSQRDCVPKPRVARHELPWDSRPDAINPNGVAATSGSARVRDWEGARCSRRFSVGTARTFRFGHDNERRSGMNAALLRVPGRALTCKRGRPRQTAQPRWGWLLFVPSSQGSSCLATLGFATESLWDSSGSNRSHSLTQRLP